MLYCCPLVFTLEIWLKNCMAKILIFDTSESFLSLALIVDDRISDHQSIHAPRRHGDLLLPMINDMLTSAELELHQLDAIAVSIGPGAFTGIRIGVSIAQGLAYGAQIPCIPLITLEGWAMAAFAAEIEGPLLVGLDARMGEVYAGVYNLTTTHELEILEEPACIQPEMLTQWAEQYANKQQLQKLCLVGSATGLFQEVEQPMFLCRPEIQCQAQDYAALALQSWATKLTIPAAEIDALYLRAPVQAS